MIRKITLFAFLLLSSFSFAQFGQGPVGHLTIFSEDGDKFFLVLNGETQNDIPQTNLRIEDLNQPYYNAKIQFEDKTLMDISKNNLMITDADGTFQDVTYKIKRDKNNKGKMKMNFFSMIPVRQGYIAPSNVYVVHYGQPREVVVQNSNPRSGVSQTTTTTTTQTGGGGNVGVGINVGGINMGVSINDNMGGGVVTQTTTTTTHSDNDYNSNQHYDNAPRGCGGRYCMSPKDFNAALATLKGQSFEDSKLKTAKQIVSANCLNVDQIMQIAKTFNFEDNTLDFAKFAYDFCTEPRSYFKVNGIFKFSSNADELSDYVQSRN
jgi:hypothetical protein